MQCYSVFVVKATQEHQAAVSNSTVWGSMEQATVGHVVDESIRSNFNLKLQHHSAQRAYGNQNPILPHLWPALIQIDHFRRKISSFCLSSLFDHILLTFVSQVRRRKYLVNILWYTLPAIVTYTDMTHVEKQTFQHSPFLRLYYDKNGQIFANNHCRYLHNSLRLVT